jgi:preprotein translocase subunit Sec63
MDPNKFLFLLACLSAAVIAHLPQDLYATLGVSRSSSTTEIKRAYKKLAMEMHPGFWHLKNLHNIQCFRQK